MTIWCPVMFRDELDMLAGRLEHLDSWDTRHVIVEAPVTHRGVPKPLSFAEHKDRFNPWKDRLYHVVAEGLDAPMKPWAREHAQRDAAWPVIAGHATDSDMVLIGDTDEFPSDAAMQWRGPGPVAVFMKTFLFAVDWRVPDDHIPPTAVMAPAGWLRRRGGSLAAARDNRGAYPVIGDGGWHFSWMGGPEVQRRKLLGATCHTELIGTEEGRLIADGTRWRTGRHGAGHLPVVPVDLDESWPGPAFIREKRCPENWWRPRHPESTAGDSRRSADPATASPGTQMLRHAAD